MKKLLPLVALGLLLTITSTQSASAIFGWECRKPKQTLEGLNKEIQTEIAKAEMLVRNEASAWYNDLKSKAAYCKKYQAFEKANSIKSDLKMSASEWKIYWKKMEKGGFPMLSGSSCDSTLATLKRSPSFDTYFKSVLADYSSSLLEVNRSSEIDEIFIPIRALSKTSHRIIVNNKKCFTPLEVAKAQEALKS